MRFSCCHLNASRAATKHFKICARWFLSHNCFFFIIMFSTLQFSLQFFHPSPEQMSFRGDAFSVQPSETLKAEKTSTLTLEKGPIFYNLFVPQETNLTSIKDIVAEQLAQRSLTSPNETMLYTLIGHRPFQQFMDRSCGANCRMQKFLNSGDEMNTLEAAHKFCASVSSSLSERQIDILVTYIHDKGSFHPTNSNTKSRRMGTKAALECRDLLMKQPNPKACNICTGVFHVFPQYLASSNMWTARCSYIRRLLPPKKYVDDLEAMFEDTLNHTDLRNSPNFVCLRPHHDAQNFWGLGRYALERWPFSHPDVKPCDILPISEGELSWDEFPQSWTPDLRKAPRIGAKGSGIRSGPYKSTWARLRGRLFEWEYIYNKTPPPNSWIWKWYRGYEDGSPGFLRKCHELIDQ